jgi:hypothetical protein
MRIYENSILTLDRVTLRKTGENQVPDTRLRLLRGAVSLRWAPAQVAKGEMSAPYHEIRGSNVVVRVERGIFFFGASGLTRVIDGTASVERTDQGITKELSGGQQYDSATGVISPIGDDIREDIVRTFYPCCTMPIGVPPPSYHIPQRPF